MILTMETPGIAEHCAELVADKLAYARRWKHDFLCLEGTLLPDLPPHFSKIQIIGRTLSLGLHQQVWWIDMDCVFTDFRTDLAEVLHEDK